MLKALAAWREVEAQRRDVPRNRIVRDEQLLDIAAHTPGDAKACPGPAGSAATSPRPHGRGIWYIKAGQDMPAERRPDLPPRQERISAWGRWSTC